MAKNFLLVSLEDEKAKKIANVVNNGSSSKILDFLTKKDATESEIAKELKLPISTVHYNLQQLIEARLIVNDKYHLSPKGKEVKHYSLANKYIIIAPKGSDKKDIIEKIREILPAFGLSIVGTLAIMLYSKFRFGAFEPIVSEVDYGFEKLDSESAPVTSEFYYIEEPLLSNLLYLDPHLWFFFGACFTVLIYIIWILIRNRLKNKSKK